MDLRFREFQEELNHLIDLEDTRREKHSTTAADVDQTRGGSEALAVLRPLNPEAILDGGETLFLST